jgi:hypothetical protein
MPRDEKNELIAWLAKHARDIVRDEIARALKSRDASTADAIGKMFAEERAKNREFVTRTLTTTEQRADALDNDAPLLDLRAERRRRSGQAA